MRAYYEPISRSVNDGTATAHYQSTDYAQGAWNPFEQHMAVATGLMARELEQFFPRNDLAIARLSLDVLGVIHQGETGSYTLHPHRAHDRADREHSIHL